MIDVLAFVFAGILCFVAAGCSVVIWGLARQQSMVVTQTHSTREAA